MDLKKQEREGQRIKLFRLLAAHKARSPEPTKIGTAIEVVRTFSHLQNVFTSDVVSPLWHLKLGGNAPLILNPQNILSKFTQIVIPTSARRVPQTPKIP